eukprot:2184034-Rhodomonas_salina.2
MHLCPTSTRQMSSSSLDFHVIAPTSHFSRGSRGEGIVLGAEEESNTWKHDKKEEKGEGDEKCEIGISAMRHRMRDGG